MGCADLLDDTMEEKRKRFSTGHYAGNKWGGKYLRAPDIFYTILEKGKGKLVELGKLADVKFRTKTGVNEFFYIDKEKEGKWKIENGFLKPVIKSPKESNQILVDIHSLKLRLFMCGKSKEELKGSNALKYIEWGEKQKTKDGTKWCNVPSVSGRKNWYDISDRRPSLLNFNYLINEYGITFYGEVFASDNLHQIFTKSDIDLYLNSTLHWLFQNLFGRVSFGGGLLKIQAFELKKTYVLEVRNNKIREKLYMRGCKSLFEEIGIDPTKQIREQEPNPLPDRAELDNIIFDELGLTKEERKEVYWAVCELVQQRLSKATSLKK